jgi:hypothetical protein
MSWKASGNAGKPTRLGKAATAGGGRTNQVPHPARERQRTAGGDRTSDQGKARGKAALPPNLGEALLPLNRHAGEAVVQAARQVGVSPQYVRDAIEIEEKHPEWGGRLDSGELSISEAKRALKQEEKAAEKN